MTDWKTKKLWTATVGSHMWGMNHKGSDIDMFDAFIIETPAVLCHKNIFKGEENNSDPNYDISSYELGHIVRNLTQGNINFLWGVMSPLTHYYDHFGFWVHNFLRKLVLENLTKNYYHSIAGLARSNLRKYFGRVIKDFESGFRVKHIEKPLLDEFKRQKKLNLIGRTLNFGSILLSEGRIDFEKKEVKDIAKVLQLYAYLKMDYIESTLPEKPDIEPFNQFLIETRIKVLNEKDF